LIQNGMPSAAVRAAAHGHGHVERRDEVTATPW
jgi:hypothetical protein